MSEEIRNEEGLNPENAEEASTTVEAAGVETSDSSESVESSTAVEPDAVETSDDVEAEESDESESSLDSAEETAQVADEPQASTAEQVDLSSMDWTERVDYYRGLGTIDGYVEALRIVDFHNPGDIQLAEVWGEILNGDGEVARELYERLSRLVTSSPDVWSGIMEAHKVALENASEAGSLAISETMGWIACFRTQEIEEGKERLSHFESTKNAQIVEDLALVATGNWRKVEQTIEAQVRETESDETAVAVEVAHRVADYALSAKALDRAVEMMRKTSRKVADNVGLKWRLAILSRDQQKWNQYVDVLSKELVNAVDKVEEKVDIYQEMIRVYRDETKQESMVLKMYEALLAVAPGNRAALESLVEIYEKMRRWPELVKLLDTQAENGNDEKKVDFYYRIAMIYLEKMNRKVDAVKYFENVLSVEPLHEASIEALKVLYPERRDWEKLLDIHRRELQRMDSLPDQIELLREMADIAKTKMRNNGAAIDVWKDVLERDPNNAEAISSLESLYESEKRWSDLAGIMEHRIALTEDADEQFQALQKLGALYSDKANDNVDAIATWRRVLAIDPTYAKGIDALRKLLIEERDWASLEAYYAENDNLPEVVKLFEQLSKTLKDDEDKKSVLLRAAHVYANSLGDSDRAMTTLEKILTIDANDAVAAKELVSYYENRSKYEDLAKMLEILYNSSEDIEERSAYGLRLAKLFETKLANDDQAYAWYMKVVSDNIRYEQAYDGLVRSSGKTGNADKVVALFRSELDKTDDVAFKRELNYRIGCLCLEYLDKAAEAQKIFESLLADDPEDIRALGALESILEREGRFNELLEVNERRMKLAKSPAELAETLLSGARIHENHLNDKAGAIESYERVCELLPEDGRPLVELHRLYAETESYEDLARVIEKQLELLGVGNAFTESREETEQNEEGMVGIVYGAKLVREDDVALWVDRSVSGIDPEEAIALWFELGEVYRLHLSEYDASVDCYDNILLIDIAHEGAIAGLEALLEAEVRVDTVARALSKVYATQEKYPELKSVLVRLGDVLPNVADKLSYYVCASQICSEYLEDGTGAMDCLARAMMSAPASEIVKQVLMDLAQRYEAWQKVIEIFEGVAKSISREENPELLTQYALELSSLWETQLDNRDKAIEYGRLGLEVGGADQEVLNYLKETFIRLESWEDVIGVLHAEAKLTEDDEVLLGINMQIASIQEASLGDNAGAIDTMLEVLEKHPENTDAMELLDRLYVACERWEEAVANCERRLELVEDQAARDEIECHMASILSEHLNESDRAFEIYSNILAHDPSHEMAISGLEVMLEKGEGAIVEQIAEILLPIYDANDAWQRRCWTDEQLLRVIVEPERRRDILHEEAMLYEQRGEEHEKAYEAYARSLKEDLRSQETIEQLFNYADVLGKWDELVGVMNEATVDADDVEAAKNIKCMVASIYREHLENLDAAIATYVEIREKDPEDLEILNALEELYREKEAWTELAEVLTAKSKLVEMPEERKALLFQAASIHEEILGDVDAAIAIHADILADEAGEPTALDCLERLYLGKEDWAELLNVYTAKLENVEDDASRVDLLFKMGVLQETKLEDNVGAIETYQRILDIEATNAEALEALDRLYLATNDMTNLLDILERREAIETDEEARVVFKFRQAECWYRNMDDCSRAIEVYKDVLEMAPDHAQSIASLEEIVALGGEVAVEAAKVLVPVYHNLARWEELVKVYEVLVTGCDDNEEAINLLGTIGIVEEEMLENPKASLDAWFRALSRDVTRDESWQKVESLAELCDCWSDLVAKLNDLIADLGSDSMSAIIVAKHEALVYEEKLGAPDKAIEAYRKILELDSNDVDAIRGLDRLYEVTEQWQELAEILRTEIDMAETDEERLGSYYRMGAVQEMYLGNYDEAIASYNEMHMIVPGQPEAIESLYRMFTAGHGCAQIAEILEAYYRDNEAWEELVNLDLQFVDHIEDHNDRYDKFIEIADVYLNQLSLIAEGLAIYGRALCERPGDELCLSKIDELSEIIQDWTHNAEYYSNAIAACDDDLIKQDLTLRMAQTYDHHLEDYENAEKCYLGVLGFDAEHLESLEALDRIYLAQERWTDLVAIIRREIPVVDSDDQRIMLYMRLGAVLNDSLGDGDAAIAAYDEILNLDPGYWDALLSLEAIYQAREDWQSLDEVYDKEAAASQDDQQRVELWGKRAQLNSEILGKTDDAIDLWYQVLDVLGDNLIALQNLEVLFERCERWTDVAEVVERQVPLAAEDVDLHLETYRKLGRIYRDKLEDNERSLDYWRNAHDVVPTDLETLRAIEALDEVLDNPDDLAEILREILQSNQLDLEDQLACAVKLAGVLDNLGRVDDTINIWLYVVQLDATHAQALNELERLYESEGRWEDVVNTLHAKIDNADDLETKVALYKQIAGIWELQVADIDQAAAAYQAILDLDASRHDVFATLEELYMNHERWQELLSAYVERADIVDDAALRLSLLERGAKIAEEKLQQPQMAFVVLQSAIAENWKNADFMAELQRLAEATGSWGELVGQFEGMIAQATSPADVLALHNIVARWYFHHLNDNEASWNHFAFVLDQDPKNLDALAAMTEIYWRLGNWDELVNILSKRLELTTVTDDRVSLYMELGKVFEEKIGDVGQAIECYIQAFKLSEDRLDVMKELARIYEMAEQWSELIDILEREMAVLDDVEEKIAVRFRIGTIWENMLQNNEKAAASYAEVVAMDETHAEALVALERLDIALERWTDLLKVYEYQLAAFQEPEQHVSIYTKVSQVYEHHLNDIENAIASMTQVMLIDPSYAPAFVELERMYKIVERWQDFIDIVNSHIGILSNPADHVELYRDLGVVYRDKLQDAYHAIESFQAIIGIVPSDVAALYALADLYEHCEDYISAIDYLGRVIDCISDMQEAVAVHFRIGTIYDKNLEDDQNAEERYKICLDIDASYMPAIDALAAMYQRHEDWNSLIRILKQKVEFTRELDAKAQINCMLGDVSLHKIDDSLNAYAYYNEALTLQPGCVAAAWPLAEKYLEEKAYARALVLYEIVINGVAFTEDAAQLYVLNYKAGYCCQNLMQHEKALEFYRASYELNQEFSPTLMGMGEELLEAKDYERAYNMFQVLLEKFADDLQPADHIQIYYNCAVAKKALGELGLARQLLERILEADGSQTKSLELIIEVCDEMEDWEALVYYMNILVERIEDKNLKFAKLMEIAKIYSEKIGDPERQIETYYRALEVLPNSRIVLNELLAIYHATAQWENAISIMEKLCENEENDEKVAEFYYAIAVIYRDELQDDVKAVEYFNKTLDLNVSKLRAFESIDKILTASRDWETLESNYKAMIQRVKGEDPDAFRDTLKLLWYGLGEIYRSRLNEWDNAIAAFQQASLIDPNDEKLHNILAELYIRMPDHTDEAIEETRTLIRLQGNNMNREQELKFYRQLYFLYYRSEQYDKAWCITDITCAKQLAREDEVAHHESGLGDFLYNTDVQRLTAEDCTNLLTHPTIRGSELTRFFMQCRKFLSEAFAHRKDQDAGIEKRSKKRDIVQTMAETPFVRDYSRIAWMLGVMPAPEVYVSPVLDHGMRIANVNYNAFIVAQRMLSGMDTHALRFILARNLHMFQSYFMSGFGWRSADLKAVLEASICFFRGVRQVNNGLGMAIINTFTRLDVASRQQIEQSLRQIEINKQPINTSLWLKGVDFTCDRVGLLMSGDFEMACACIRESDKAIGVSKLTNDERIEELTRFALSDEYFQLRVNLGLNCF